MFDKLDAMPRDHIRFIFRGRVVQLKGFSPVRTLLDWLREDQRATGTKEGCNEGDCGACTVVLVRVENGQLVRRPVNACITFLGMVDGAEVLTIEDLADGAKLHPIQQAMVDHHGSQCGFCTPGIVMSLYALDADGMPVERNMINDQLAGNLCRCTGYRPIMDAALAALNPQRPDHLDRNAKERIKRLVDLDDSTGAHVTHDGGFFAAPRTLQELLALYAQHPDATILAGATDVGLWITKQFRPITKLIWLGRVSELQAMSHDSEKLVIGAGVSHEMALPLLASLSPDLGELGRRFGSTQVRAQGTVGGNIANGSPIGDWAPAFIALDASVTLMDSNASRDIPLENFFIAYGKQDRRKGEIVSALTIPRLKPNQHFRCLKISKRFDEDISALMGAFRITLDGQRITSARIAFGGMAATPKRAPLTEAALLGATLGDQASWQKALAALDADYQPIDDMRASARYRQETAKALLTKALMELAGAKNTRVSRLQSQEASHAH
ncbi:MAG: xanthine dehydrogenase small subunit [Beijerinckiaceae bacterium]